MGFPPHSLYLLLEELKALGMFGSFGLDWLEMDCLVGLLRLFFSYCYLIIVKR